MGKNNDKKETISAAKTGQEKANTDYTNRINQNAITSNAEKATAQSSRNSLEAGYKALDYNTPAFNMPDYTEASYTAPSYNAAKVNMKDFDSGARDRVNSDITGLRELGKTGGIDDASATRFRGNGVFDEFANTGGYSQKDRSNILARGLSPISAFAKSSQDEMTRRRNVQGGYSPGFDATNRALSRDASRGIADMSLDANLGIMDKVNEGRRWGSSSMSDAENRLMSLRTGNQLRGLEGAAGNELNLENSVLNQGNVNNSLLRGLASDENTFNLGEAGMRNNFNLGNTGMRNSFNVNSSGMLNDFNSRNADRNLDVDVARLGGLSNIYGTDVDQYQAGLDRGNDLFNNRINADLGYLNARGGLTTGGSGWTDKLLGLAGAGAGAASAYYGGRR